MAERFILTEYVNRAMGYAVRDELEGGTSTGRIHLCKWVVAFGTMLRECEDELRSTLGDWILIGFKLEHCLPTIDSIGIKNGPRRNAVEAV